MSSSPNPHARLIFKEAFDKLKETVDSINPQHIPLFQNTKLEDVFNASREIEKGLAKRKCMRNMRRLTPFLRSLEHYSKSVEVLCNGTPYLPWIWAPIKVTLQIASEFPAAMEKLIATYSKITEVMPRFDRLSEAFKKDQTLHRVMAMAYTDILDFHREAYSFFNQSGWRIFFNTLWGKAERRFKIILDSLAENCRLVETEAKTADIVEAASFRVRMKEQMRDQELQRTITRLQAALAWLDAKDEDQENELDRLRSRVFQHSCDWIQRQNEGKAWMSIGGSHPVLWLIGKPGAGKSTLSATIIHFLLQDRHSAVLYYLCNHQSSESTDSAPVLRTLLSELLRLNNDMAEHIYDEHITKGNAPSVPRLKQLLQRLLSAVPSTCIIIDGVDELESRCCSQVLNDVLALVTVPKSKVTCRLLVSSRDIFTISKIMSKYPTLNLDNERHLLDPSITSFVHHGLSDMRCRLGQTQQVDNHVYEDLAQTLIEKAEGMFLWIRLVMHSLENSSNILELRRTVDELPKDLDQMYSKILVRIAKELGTKNWEAVRTMFPWMVYGARDLKSFELLSAISLCHGSFSQGYHAYEWEWALDKCKPLLEVTKSGTVSFTHSTVHEYFTKGTGIITIDPVRARLEISHGCLSCLSQGLDILDPSWSIQRRMLEVAGGRYALLRYSIDFWLRHLFASADKMKTGAELERLLEAIDELDDRHEMVKGRYPPKKKPPIADAKPLEESVLSTRILELPHLKDMLVDHLQYESTLKNAEFTCGQDSKTFKINHDPVCFSIILQTYQDTVHQIVLNDRAPGDPSITIFIERFKKKFAIYAYSCQFWGCGAYLSSVAELTNHETMHSGGIKCSEVSCPFSRIGFATAAALKGHMRKYHPQKADIRGPTTIRRRYVCSGVVDEVVWGCKQRFAIERELQRHINSRRGTSCDRTYMRLRQLPPAQLPLALLEERSMTPSEHPILQRFLEERITRQSFPPPAPRRKSLSLLDLILADDRLSTINQHDVPYFDPRGPVAAD